MAFEFFSSTVLYGQQTLERACAELASLGVGSVDIWHVRGWCEHLRDGVPAVRDTLARHGLRLEAVTAYGADDATLERLLPVVAELGGSTLVTGSAAAQVPVTEFAQRLAPRVAQAASLGVRLAVENHGDATVDSIASMLELTSRVPDAALGIALAPIHLWRRGEDTAEAIRALRDRIAFMYIWDWGPTADRHWKDPQEQFIGTGRIAFAPIFRALAEVHYGRPLCVFAHGPEHWPPERTTAELGAALERARTLAAAAGP